MTAAVADINSRQAKQLWSKLQQHFINAGRVIEEIVDRRAWEPLGYGTFAEAWSAQMSDITIAAEVRPHVVYQMLTEGVSPGDIADLVKGIGPNGTAALDRQRRNGVPADFAVVNEHLRRKPCAPDTLHIKVGRTMLEEYRRIADQLDMSVEEIAKEAVAERFSQLVSQKRKRV